MIYLVSIPKEVVVPFREIARQMDIPEDFLAKILKILVDENLVESTRGPHGGYALARSSNAISVLDVIEAVEGPVALNVCLDGEHTCGHSNCCTMAPIWRIGQEKMLDVYRETKLSSLAVKPADNGKVGLVSLGSGR